MSDVNEKLLYKVVVNQEEQYSLLPVDYDLPAGWKNAGKSGSRAECLDYIRQVWTDMRPLSLRQQMAQHGNRTAE